MDILETLVRLYSYLIIIYILLSWFPGARESAIGGILAKIVEPYLEPFRRFIPPIGGVLDISPIIALFVLRIAFNGLDFLITSFM